MPTTIIQLNREELRAEIKSLLKEFITEIKSLPVQPEQPDIIDINEACIELGTKEKPVSKSQLYKWTMEQDNGLPFKKRGKRLIFSRKELRKWNENRTIVKESLKDAAVFHLQKQTYRKAN